MKLVSLRKTVTEKKDDVEVGNIDHLEDFPWGTRIHLSDDEVRKLSGAADCNTGDRVMIAAVGKIISTSSDEVGGTAKISMTIQLQDMALEKAEPEDNRAANMYGGI